MKIKKQLRKPENWQDFESLCKKLWGEIWKCPEIKKNGRSGQNQHGIDIYGIPFGEREYFGVQCKGKDEYSHNQLTESEIENEIEKVKTFEPPIKKIFFTTTANKDAKIESFIRKKNIEHLKTNLFEVHIFSWEDIVDLIEENKHTYDYYVKSKNYKTEQSARLVFENNKDKITLNVPFIRRIKKYELTFPFGEYTLKLPELDNLRNSFHFFNNSKNNSFCRFYFRLKNFGNEPITEFKIFFEFEGKYKSIQTCSKSTSLYSNQNIKYDTFIWEDNKKGKIIPLKNILVQEDSIGFDEIAIKPFPEETTIEFNWKLVSIDYKNEGKLFLTINPEFEIKEETIHVDNPKLVRIEENVEDYITKGKSHEETE